MAKRKVNKSQEIREYVIANPGSSAKDVVSALAKKRIQVSPSMVATVKFKAGLTKSRKKGLSFRGGKGNGQMNVNLLVDAKKFRAKAGSTQAAIEALKTIDMLESV